MINTQSSDWLLVLANASSLLKVSAFFLIWMLVWLPIAIPLARKIGWYPGLPLRGESKIPMIVSLYLIAPLIVWFATKVEGTSFVDYGLQIEVSLVLSLALGVFLAVTSLVLIFGIEWLCGWITWNLKPNLSFLSLSLPLLGLGLGVGLIEELVFRGFLLSELRQDYSLIIAALIASVIFALLHLIWDYQETLPQLPGLLLMGLVLVVAVLADHGSIGLAWGLHAGWIWGLATLDATGLISYTGKAKIWLTGFGGQPLAGVAGIVCLLLTAVCLWLLFPDRLITMGN